MKILLMADKQVGHAITEWLIKKYKDDIAIIVTTTKNEISFKAETAGVQNTIFSSIDQLYSELIGGGIIVDYGILAWWPKIIKKPLLTFPKHAFINTHPSLVPYNRGKHSNFWALAEQTPFGVSLHFVDEGIDCGDIIAQTPINYNWEDNGRTIYEKALIAMADLFKKTYPDLRRGHITRIPQNLSQGSFHFANELEQASIIELDRKYKARDLFNLIRARTFPGYPSCFFKDKGEEYEIRTEIKRKSR
jgi:methionyl-tRNA formyltransferase